MADFIHKVIQYPPVLLGHSFGGLIVQYYIANVGHEKLQGQAHFHVIEKQEIFVKLA